MGGQCFETVVEDNYDYGGQCFETGGLRNVW